MDKKSQLAYLNQLVYEDRKQWRSGLKKVGMSDWKIDNLSKDNTMVLSNSKTKELRVIHSGTDLKRRPVEDLLTDVGISFGFTNATQRYRKSRDITRKAIVKYEGYTPIVAGFSLGGAVANEIGQELNVESHAFNPGVSPLVLKTRLTDLKSIVSRGTHGDPDSKHKVYVTPTDWISASGALGVTGKEHVTLHKPRQGTEGPHDIANFYNIATE
jgi:hypothetical protein